MALSGHRLLMTRQVSHHFARPHFSVGVSTAPSYF